MSEAQYLKKHGPKKKKKKKPLLLRTWGELSGMKDKKIPSLQESMKSADKKKKKKKKKK